LISLLQPLVGFVEDEPALATMLRNNPERQGIRVEEAKDTQGTPMCIAETQPDLVLVDWKYSGMSGLGPCGQIRRQAAMRAVFSPEELLVSIRGTDIYVPPRMAR
jgi:two-component system, OmpR family, phosphate regulon response regulator PhoB